jgi:hypothetical protein
MSVTVINMRQLQNAAGVPAYPDSPPNTIYAEDWNPVRESISKGLSGIWTKGIKLGSDGFETIGTTPFLMAAGLLQFRDGSDVDEPVVGFISNDGELGMVKLRADQQLTFGADADMKYEGDGTRSVPETTPTDWHLITQRGAGEVEDFEVYHNGSLEVMRLLQGDFVANKIGSGFVMRFATGLSRIRMHASGYPVIEDADDFAARPTTWTNERRIMTGADVFVSDVIADPSSPILVTEPSADPKIKEVSIANIGAAFLAIGAGATDVNVDALMAGGGGSGSLAQLATPAEVAAITANSAAIAALQAEIATTVKTFRTATGDVISPLSGQILFANSSSTLFDRPAANTIRAVSSGGGGGGGAVDSVTAGNGIENIGTSANPILQLDLKASGGLQFNAGEVELAYSGSGGDLGSSGLPARSDHAHAALYSVLAHTHAGFATIGDITYENLDANGDVGTGAAQLAAGNDSRFHTQGTDQGLDSGGPSAVTAAQTKAAYDHSVLVAGNPHAVDAAQAGADAAGTAAAAVGAHESAGNPHPVYLTEPEGDALYEPLGGGAGEETFTGFATTISLTEKLIGGPISPGVTVRRAGTLNVGRLRSDVDLAGGSLIQVTISNLTTPASATIQLGPGQQSQEELALGIPFLAGEQIDAVITTITGAPLVSELHLQLVRE